MVWEPKVSSGKAVLHLWLPIYVCNSSSKRLIDFLGVWTPYSHLDVEPENASRALRITFIVCVRRVNHFTSWFFMEIDLHDPCHVDNQKKDSADWHSRGRETTQHEAHLAVGGTPGAFTSSPGPTRRCKRLKCGAGGPSSTYGYRYWIYWHINDSPYSQYIEMLPIFNIQYIENIENLNTNYWFNISIYWQKYWL